MYKTVLLTVSEINLIRKVLQAQLKGNLTQIKHKEAQNLHIIDRALFGKIPTKLANENIIKG